MGRLRLLSSAGETAAAFGLRSLKQLCICELRLRLFRTETAAWNEGPPRGSKKRTKAVRPPPMEDR